MGKSQVARHSDSGYWNEYARPRKLTLSSGTMEVSQPRVCNPEEMFESRLLPLFTRRTIEGMDVSRWPTAKHFASWLGLSPNNRVRGGRVMISRTTRNANRAATALRLVANALHRSDSVLGAFLRRKKAQLEARRR